MSDSENDNIIIASSTFIIISQLLKKKRKKRRWLMKKSIEKRMKQEEENSIFKDICRMASEDFEHLLCLISDKICKKNTNFKESVPAYDRLAVTLRFLATGDTYANLTSFTKMSKGLICITVSEVCAAIVEALRDYVKPPSTEEEWLSIAKGFDEKWNFPNCVGAVAGKRCILRSPMNIGSDHYKYKSKFCVLLMGVVDADYNVIFADCQGKIPEYGVFGNTTFNQRLINDEFNMPEDQCLPGKQLKVPYVFVADNALLLKRRILRPYPGTHAEGSEKSIYNYRLSRARNVVDNAFGALSSVFRVLQKPLSLQPDKACLVAMTCICLHNYLMKRKASRILYNSEDMMDRVVDGAVIPGLWRNSETLQSFFPLNHIGQRHTKTNEQIRKEFSDYFNHSN